jgi:hypothetical protein
MGERNVAAAHSDVLRAIKANLPGREAYTIPIGA